MSLFNRVVLLAVAAAGSGIFPVGLPGGLPRGMRAVVAQEAAPVEAPPVTGQYVPQGTTAVITLHPRAFFSQRSMRLMPLEMIRATGEQQIGIDPLQIQQIKVVLGEIGPMGPAVGAVVQMAQPAEVLGLGDRWVHVEEPMTIDGKDFYPIEGPPGFSLHVTDPEKPHTALVGIQSQLEQMLAAAGGEPPLAPLLERMQPSDHAMALLAIEPIRPMLQVALDQQLPMLGPALPESVLALRAFPALTDYLLLRVNLGDSFGAQLTILATDEQAAEQLQGLVTAAMSDVRDAMLQQMEPDEFDEPAMQDAQRKYAQRMSGEILQALTPVRDGRRLTITVQEDVPHVAMLGIMTGLTLPAIQAARGAARRMQSSNNLKQIGLAMHNYESAYKGLPDPAIRDEDDKPLLSWRVAVLPFVEGAQLYERFHLDEPWDSEHNLKLVKEMPAVYRHPSSTAPAGHTVYQAIVGEEIGLRPEGKTRFTDFRDGLSNTILVAETEDEFAVPWTKPADVTIDPDNPWPPLGGHNREGVNMLFGDGSVRLVPYWLEPEKLWHLMTRAGGEVVENF